MKNASLTLGICGMLVCILGLSGTALADEANAPLTYHYYHFDEPVWLTLDTTRVALRTDSAVDATRRDAGRDALLAAGVAPDAVRPNAIGEWTVAELSATTRSADAVRALVASVAATPDAGFVSPVFLDDQGQPVLMTRDLFVKFRDDITAQDARDILAAVGAGSIVSASYADMPGVYRLRTPVRDGFDVLELANLLAQLPETDFAEPDKVITGRVAILTPNDPYRFYLWGINNTGQSGGTPDMDMDGYEAWDIETGDASVKVAILDLGIQQNHPDINQVTGYNATNSGPAGGGPETACDNHGTLVAGCVSAIINNGIGVVGIAPDCKSVSVKIGRADQCNGYFTAQDSWLVDGLDWAMDNGCLVTNSSFQWGASSTISNMYTLTRNAGLIHFASSGNNSNSSIGYPASLSSVNAVGALTRNGFRASFSNYGTGLAFSAPGDDIYTTDRTGSAGYDSGDYTWTQGTSFSSPYAAGVAALIRSLNPSLTPTEVEAVMQATAVDLGYPGYDTTYGWGFVNAYHALLELSTVPGPFNLTAPDDGVTGLPTNPTFTWTAATDVDTYTLKIDTAPTLDSADLIAVSGLTETSYAFPENWLREASTYYWRVEAWNAAGSRVSEPEYRTFTTFRDCDGNEIDDGDEIAADPSLDCNGNGWLDSCDIGGITINARSPNYSPLGGVDHTYEIAAAPVAVGDVTLTFYAIGDLNSFAAEYVDIELNGTPIGTVYDGSGIIDCGDVDQVDALVLSATEFNDLVTGGTASITMIPSLGIDAGRCDNDPNATYIGVWLSYPVAPTSADCNENGTPDECDIDSGTSEDVNENGVPDECEAPIGCAGDANCDGAVNWRDIDFFVAAQNDAVSAWAAMFAPEDPTCPFDNNDANGDGSVNWRDIDPFVGLQNTTCP